MRLPGQSSKCLGLKRYLSIRAVKSDDNFDSDKPVVVVFVVCLFVFIIFSFSFNWSH